MLMLLTSEIPWLLARAHELDTQAELMVDVYKGADLPELVARVNAAEARVRELEAQVKRGAAVIDAAREWAKARNAVQTETGNIGTDWRKNGYDWKAAIARKARAEARAKKAEHNLRVAIDALATPKGIEEE